MPDKEFIYFPEPKITKDTITFYGAGKFGEESLTLNKDEAILAFIKLQEFLFKEDGSQTSYSSKKRP